MRASPASRAVTISPEVLAASKRNSIGISLVWTIADASTMSRSTTVRT